MKKNIIIIVSIILVVTLILMVAVSNNKENKTNSKEKTIENKERKLTEIITSDNYGDYINYHYDYNGNGDITDDWRIFLNDGENVYLIASESIPEALEPETKEFNNFEFLDNRIKKYFSFGESYKKDSTTFTKAMNRTAILLDTTMWQNFVNKNADYAIGGPTIEMFLKAYNEVNDIKIDYQISEFGYEIKSKHEIEDLSSWTSTKTLSEVNELYDSNTNKYSSYSYFSMNIASPAGGEETWINNEDTSMLFAITTEYKENMQEIGWWRSEFESFKPIICLKSDTIGSKKEKIWNINE